MYDRPCHREARVPRWISRTTAVQETPILTATSRVVIQWSATTTVLPLPLQTIKKLGEFGPLHQHLTRQHEAERSERASCLSRICTRTHEDSLRLLQKDMFVRNHHYLHPRDERQRTLAATNMGLRSARATSIQPATEGEAQRQADTRQRRAQREETTPHVQEEGRQRVVVIMFLLGKYTRAQDVNSPLSEQQLLSKGTGCRTAHVERNLPLASLVNTHPPTPGPVPVESTRRNHSAPVENPCAQRRTETRTRQNQKPRRSLTRLQRPRGTVRPLRRPVVVGPRVVPGALCSLFGPPVVPLGLFSFSRGQEHARSLGVPVGQDKSNQSVGHGRPVGERPSRPGQSCG